MAVGTFGDGGWKATNRQRPMVVAIGLSYRQKSSHCSWSQSGASHSAPNIWVEPSELLGIDNFNNLFSLGGRDAKDTQSFSARAQETGLRESGPDVPSWAKGVRARVALLEPPTAHLAT